MALKNTPSEYGSAAKFFHWLIAVLIIGMIVLGLSFDSMAKPDRLYWINIHKSIGLTIIGLMILRLVWRISNTQPQWPTMPKWQVVAAHGIHWLLYLAIFVVLFSGWTMSGLGGHTTYYFGLFNATLPLAKNVALEHRLESVHEYTAYIIIALVSIHVLAALKHHFVDKDNVLRNMLPLKRKTIDK